MLSPMKHCRHQNAQNCVDLIYMQHKQGETKQLYPNM